MIRTINVVERDVVSEPKAPVAIGANAAGVDVLPDLTQARGEWVTRSIQNVGGNACNFAIGTSASATYYSGQLQPGQQLDCTMYGPSRINVYAASATTIAVISMMRLDLTTPTTFVPAD